VRIVKNVSGEKREKFWILNFVWWIID